MDSLGRYVLNKKTSYSSLDPTNKAVNKVFAYSLTEAVNLLVTDNYLINLVDEEGTRALREFKKLKIEYAKA